MCYLLRCSLRKEELGVDVGQADSAPQGLVPCGKRSDIHSL